MTLREELMRNSGINTINEETEILEEGAISKVIGEKIGAALADKLSNNKKWQSMSKQERLDSIKIATDRLYKFAGILGLNLSHSEDEMRREIDRAQKRIDLGDAAKDFEDSEAPADEKEAEDDAEFEFVAKIKVAGADEADAKKKLEDALSDFDAKIKAKKEKEDEAEAGKKFGVCPKCGKDFKHCKCC